MGGLQASSKGGSLVRSGLLVFAILLALAHAEAAQVVQLQFLDSGDDTLIALFSQKHVALNGKGYGEIDFATPSGKLLIRRVDDRIVADANDDGRIDEADGTGVAAAGPGRVKPSVVKVPAMVGGRTVQYPLTVLLVQGAHLLLGGGGVLAGELGDLELRLYDVDLDGIFGEAGTDRMLVRAAGEEPGASARIMGRVIELDGRLCSVRMLDGGRTLEIAPYGGAKAALELETEDGVVELTLSLAHEDGACYAHATRERKVLLVPGEYRVIGSHLALKLPPQKEEDRSLFDDYFRRTPDRLRDAGILAGARSRRPALITIRPGDNRLSAGPPLRLDFSAFVWETHGDRLEVGDAALVGRAGERYVPELGGTGRHTSSLKSFLRSGGGPIPSRRLDCGQRGITGGPIPVRDDVAADADAEIVLKFEAPGVGTVTAAKRLAELPRSKPSLNGLTSVAREMDFAGRYAEAVKFFGEAVGLYPDNSGLLNNFAWFLVTVEDEKLRDAERALPMARRAVELTNEQEGYALDTLAEVLYQAGKLEEAASYAARAAEKDHHPEIRERAKRFKEELEKKRAREN